MQDKQIQSEIVVVGVRLEVFSDLKRQYGKILGLKPNGDYVYGVFGAATPEKVQSWVSTG